MEAAPALPTAFEEQVKKLGLTEQSCETSDELRQWCKSNKDRCYVPERLLKKWQISVDPNVSSWRSYGVTCLSSSAPHHSFLSLEPVVRLFYVDEFPSLFAFFVQPRVQIFGLA